MERVNKLKSIDLEISKLFSQQKKYRYVIHKPGLKPSFEFPVPKSKLTNWESGFAESSFRHKIHKEFTLRDLNRLDVRIGDEISRLSPVYGFNTSC